MPHSTTLAWEPRTRRFLIAAAVLAALAAAILTAPPVALSSERFELGSPAGAIWNLAGHTRIEGGAGKSIVVLAERGGRDATRLSFSSAPIGGEAALHVEYPDAHVVYPKLGLWSHSTVRLHADGTWGGKGDWGGHTVTVTGAGNGLEAHADLVVQVPTGGKVSVHTVAGDAELENVDGKIAFDGGAGPVTCTHARGDLSIDVGSGGVTVQGFDGSLSVDTGSGGVELDDVSGTTCHVDTGSGGVKGDGVAVRDLDVDTGSGGVHLSGVDAKNIKVDTGSGGVDLGVLEPAPHVEIDTGSGPVRFLVPGDFSARLDLDAGSGGVSSDLPIAIEERDHGTLTGRIGSGEGHVHVDTGSGGVHLGRGASRAPSRTR